MPAGGSRSGCSLFGNSCWDSGICCGVERSGFASQLPTGWIWGREEDPEGPGREGGEGGPHSYSEYRRMDKP